MSKSVEADVERLNLEAGVGFVCHIARPPIPTCPYSKTPKSTTQKTKAKYQITLSSIEMLAPPIGL